MTDIAFTYDEHMSTFMRLKDDMLRLLSDKEKELLLAFVSLQECPPCLGIHNFDQLPGIIWKRRNLMTLKESNKEKFEAQFRQLAELLN